MFGCQGHLECLDMFGWNNSGPKSKRAKDVICCNWQSKMFCFWFSLQMALILQVRCGKLDLDSTLMKSMRGWEERMLWVKSSQETATCDAVFVARHRDQFVDVEGWDLKSDVFWSSYCWNSVFFKHVLRKDGLKSRLPTGFVMFFGPMFYQHPAVPGACDVGVFARHPIWVGGETAKD